MDPMYRNHGTEGEERREWHTMVDIEPRQQHHHQQQQYQRDPGPSIEGATPSSALVRSASLRRRSGKCTKIASTHPQDGRQRTPGHPDGIEQQPQSEDIAVDGVNIYPNLAEVVEDLENIRPLHEKIARQKQ